MKYSMMTLVTQHLLTFMLLYKSLFVGYCDQSTPETASNGRDMSAQRPRKKKGRRNAII